LNFFYVALNMLSNFKHVFFETMFLKSLLYKTPYTNNPNNPIDLKFDMHV